MFMASSRDFPLDFDAVIIGGGFFGCCVAIHLQKKNKKVLILEMGDDILGRASYANQARVHNGYHYPRSILTALRSRVNFPKFVNDYPETIFSEFEQYYAIGKFFSKVTANQYQTFIERIGAEIYPAPQKVKKLLNPTLVEDIFSVKEYAFDALKLREHVRQEIRSLGVQLKVNTKVKRLSPYLEGIKIEIETSAENHEPWFLQTPKVYNCTYSHINQILKDSHIEVLTLKHELTEMVLLEMPEELRSIGITVMCGPFFSFMPFPSTNLHTLSHVRYTPHCHWIDNESAYKDSYLYLVQNSKGSHATQMIKDSQRYIPVIKDSRYVDSIWEIKTVLPSSETDDSRPIMIKRDHGIQGLTCILGGKIDNIYDVLSEIDGDGN